MRIGINLLYMIPGVVGGTETYAVSLLRALERIDASNRYVLFVNREAEAYPWRLGPHFEVHRTGVAASSRIARYAWEQTMFGREVRRHHLDLLHSMGYIAPLRLPCPSVVTIHDLNYQEIPTSFSATRRRALAYFVPRSARRAARVLTVSEFSRRAIIDRLRIPPHRVIVTANAAKPRAPAPPTAFADVARRHGIRPGYVLALSSKSRHKNIARLVEAFSMLDPDLAPQLVLAGHSPVGGEPIYEQVKRTGLREGRVVFTGFLSDIELSALWENAACFVFPSLYEGFGIPVLEAMASGVPVVSSNAASLPEVVGDAGLLVDPRSSPAIASAIRNVLSDAELRRKLRERGRVRAGAFSWDDTARRTLGAYSSVVAARDHA